MGDFEPSPNSPKKFVIVGIVLLGLVIVAMFVLESTPSLAPAPKQSPTSDTPVSQPIAFPPESDQGIAGIRSLCGNCHSLPDPASFPKRKWPGLVDTWYQYARQAGMKPEQIVDINMVKGYFHRRAPETLDFSPLIDNPLSSGPLEFEKHTYNALGVPPLPRITNVRWVRLKSENGLDCIVSDMQHGKLFLWEFDQPDAGLVPIADVAHPSHVEVSDLNQDGHPDLIVADLGTFFPDDSENGRILWLRYDAANMRYEPEVLARKLGRVADVQSADFDGDGDLDLIAAVFGWRSVGEVLYYENISRDIQQPRFRAPRQIDKRNGAIHVPIADINQDGRLDFVVLLSQQHEEVIAYLNEGSARFSAHTIYKAEDPAYGSTGIQLADIDGDNDLDVVYTNGDLMDSGMLKPYHSVQWLENKGSYPFTHHHLAPMPGVHRAVAGDFDQDGDQDIIAVSFVPDTSFFEREQWPLNSILWIEQTGLREFTQHALETILCDHTTADLADYDRDGDLDLVTGTITWAGISGIRTPPRKTHSITIWENRGPRTAVSESISTKSLDKSEQQPRDSCR